MLNKMKHVVITEKIILINVREFQRNLTSRLDSVVRT